MKNLTFKVLEQFSDNFQYEILPKFGITKFCKVENNEFAEFFNFENLDKNTILAIKNEIKNLV